MVNSTLDAIKEPLKQFENFDADTQLALLWYGYLDIKDQLNPNPDSKVEGMGQTLYDHIAALSKDDQLQAQRDIANRANTDISKQYGALSPSSKLETWLLLAQGMESGEIISVPSDYSLPDHTQGFVDQIKALDFEQRITFTRDAVTAMGA